MSAEGQVRYTARVNRKDDKAQINPDAGLVRVATETRSFLQVVEEFYKQLRLVKGASGGFVNVELREITGWSIYFDGDLVILPVGPRYGRRVRRSNE